MREKKQLRMALIIFSISLYLVWAVVELFIVPCMEGHLTLEAVEVIKETVIKIVVWFIPAAILCIHFSDFMYVKKQEIFAFKAGWIRWVPMFLILGVYQLISAYVTNGSISVSETFKVSDILLAFTVGISEEMVFRGWLLNSMVSGEKKWIPVLINAAMFLIIHFPVWFRCGLFTEYFASGAFIYIIILSVLFSWTFIKSRSVIVPAALHMFWDLLCWLL